MMMKSARDRLSGDPAKPLDRPMARRIFVRGKMCSEPVAITCVGSRDLTQVNAGPAGDRGCHSRKTLRNHVTVGRVSDEVIGRLIPRERIGDLPGDPVCTKNLNRIGWADAIASKFYRMDQLTIQEDASPIPKNGVAGTQIRFDDLVASMTRVESGQ